ncbi:type 1 fimbrial protein [Leclercia sp. J807]|uniref:fimbrial protein n=1 Tax=Leclercia sp. J807 TaxID=2681307 RepID=UPI0012E19EBB|nr:fimbrial protein [Leclercia sp. J807]QGU12669.1 type 1 fimbrial protein [Leclercia sp. J807]
MKDSILSIHQKRKAPALLLCLAAGMLSYSANADTQLNITGTIKASPCKIDVPAGGVNVDLGQNIMAGDLSEAKSATEWKPIAIAVSECPATTSKVTMALSGTADTDEPDMYKNNGTAEQVQIQLQNTASGQALGNASTLVQDVESTSKGTTFNMQARAYSSKGNATPGSILGVVQLTFTYQ